MPGSGLSPDARRVRVALAPLALAALLAASCQDLGPRVQGPSDRWADFTPLVAMEEGPSYHLLQGYDPIWLRRVQQGIETARAYFGSYGPVHVYVLGREADGVIDPQAREAFIEEVCVCRHARTDEAVGECQHDGGVELFEALERGEGQAYLSYLNDIDPPIAQLMFVNLHGWYSEEAPVSEPILRGIHEYTHVFQCSVGPLPTWIMEGCAVFSEAWFPRRTAGHDLAEVMRRSMESAKQVEDPELGIEHMEEIESASEEVERYYRNLAYDAGAWAIAFLIHESPSRSVAALRDEFYPSVTELGWELALPEYVGMSTKQEFYAAFKIFMALPIDEQLLLLDDLRE